MSDETVNTEGAESAKVEATVTTPASKDIPKETGSKEPAPKASSERDDIIKQLRRDIRSLSKKAEEYETKYTASYSELTSLKSEIAERDKKGREDTLLSNLYEQSGQSKFIVRSAYLGAVADGKLARYPEDVDSAVAEARKVLSELEPGLFGDKAKRPLAKGGVPARKASSRPVPKQRSSLIWGR